MTDKLFIYNTASTSKRELFHYVSLQLLEQGYVTEAFEQALTDREEHYPTGLPVDPPIAIPHTDGTHVLKDAIVAVLNEHELDFQALGGGPKDLIYPRLAFFLVIKEGQGHLEELQKLVERVQDSELVQRILNSHSAEEFEALASQCL